MKKQAGMSALKLILIIALGILMAGFIGCVGSFLVTGAVVTGVANAIATKNPHQIEVNENQRQALESQRQSLENQRKMNAFVEAQRQIQLHRPIEQPTQSYIEINGKRIAIKPNSKPANNPPPTNKLHRRIEIHVYGNQNITAIEDVIYRKIDTRPNAPLIEKNIRTGSDSTIFAEIEWKESMPNPPEIKSTVDEIIDMSQNVDSEQKKRIEKLLARMQKPVYTRIDHDILNKPKPIS